MGSITASREQHEDKEDREKRRNGETGKGLSTLLCFASPLHQFPNVLDSWLYLLPSGIYCLSGSNSGARSTTVALFLQDLFERTE